MGSQERARLLEQRLAGTWLMQWATCPSISINGASTLPSGAPTNISTVELEGLLAPSSTLGTTRQCRATCKAGGATPRRRGLRCETTSIRRPEQNGCQLSLVFNCDLNQVHSRIEKRGVVCDVRLPSAMRIAPAPLYNSFNDVLAFVTILQEALHFCAQ